MGTWNAGLFSNDTTCDVKDTYRQFLVEQFSNEEAYQKTYEEYEELMGTDEEPLFWYALADTQWNVGRLMPEVKERALELIGKKGALDLWEESPKGALRWERTMKKLKDKLESEMPPEKKFRKPVEFEHNPWNLGDVYAYQFHTEKAKEYGFFGKYILFQKVSDVEYYDGDVYTMVQVFDEIFDSIPDVDVIDDIRVLPLVGAYDPNENEDYVPISWFLKTMMWYEKKCHYPKKFFTFVGNKYVPIINYEEVHYGELRWDKDDLDSWLIDFYLSWQGFEYKKD